MKSKRANYITMTVLVFIWGLDYIVAKNALETVPSFTLLFYKYIIGFLVLLPVALIKNKRIPFCAKDIPLLAACAGFGEVLYFSFEYTAMDYLPVSVITIVLAFVPALSVLIERILYKRSFNGKMAMGILFCILGVALVIGADFSSLKDGKLLGYVLVFGAVIAWNIYNFMTEKLTGNYDVFSLSLYQTAFAALFFLPFAIARPVTAEMLTPAIIAQIVYLGIIGAALAFLIYVGALGVIGPTPCALFSNFLPVTTTVLGWLFLKESISLLQALGGVVVIAAGCIVIIEKERLENGGKP